MRPPPFAIAAAASWLAALVCIGFPDGAPVLSAALWLAASAALLAHVRGMRAGVTVIALALAAACASHVALLLPARDAAAADAGGGRAVEVHATVTSKVEGPDGQERFDADASRIVAGDHVTAVAFPIAVRGVTETGGGLDLGAEVVVRGTAQPSADGERAVLVVFASRGVEVVQPPPGFLGVAATLRDAFVARASALPDPGGGLLPGLAVGDTRAVPPELQTAMTQTSLSHLTAVSGANCALVVGLAFGGAALLGARRGIRITAGIGALTGFVTLVTPEPSVIRAAAMAAIAMIALALGRRIQGLAVLGLAVTVLLVADPWLAVSLGFALSAAATGALLVLAPGIARGLSRWMPRPLAVALAVPLSTQLACGPLLVLIDPSVPVYAVPANLLAEPAAPLATVVGLAACLATPLPALADGLSAIAWLPATWISGTATTFAGFPAGSVGWMEGATGSVAMAAVSALLVASLLRADRPRIGDRVLHAATAVTIAGIVGGSAGSLLLAGPIGIAAAPADWSIAACDVGQGDALVVRSAGRIALIDTGPDPQPLRECLAQLGVDQVDLLVLTHFDADHRGGAEALIGRTQTVLHGPTDGPDAQALLDSFRAHGAQVVRTVAGMSGTIGGARWRALWPRGEPLPGNDAGVVVEVRGGGVPASLYLADLSAQAQQGLRATGGLDPPYAVVKVAHHGSADQDPALYGLLRGSLDVISAGAGNPYGHPRASTLALLDSTRATLARTDRDGLVLIAARGDGLSVWRERSDQTVGAGP